MAGDGLIHYGRFDYLKESMEATNEELDCLRRLRELKSKQQASEIIYGTLDFPSMIIDNFLYHGDFDQARNMKLLKELNIRHIITVCEFKLKKEILNKFNVLWINLHDIPSADIRQHFDQTNEFLNVCRSKNEKVLVHCQIGVSRSSSIVLAYRLK
jgi:protein-tyrosine phosphatase